MKVYSGRSCTNPLVLQPGTRRRLMFKVVARLDLFTPGRQSKHRMTMRLAGLQSHSGRFDSDRYYGFKIKLLLSPILWSEVINRQIRRKYYVNTALRYPSVFVTRDNFTAYIPTFHLKEIQGHELCNNTFKVSADHIHAHGWITSSLSGNKCKRS